MIGVETKPGIKMNLGCQDKYREGWYNVDVSRRVKCDAYGDIRIMACPDNYASQIYASHVMEHLAHEEFQVMLRRFYKWLQPGGVLEIAVPNLQVLGQFLASGVDDIQIKNWVFGSERADGMRHCWGYTEETLTMELESAGFKIEGSFPGNEDDSGKVYMGKHLSLNLRAVKP